MSSDKQGVQTLIAIGLPAADPRSRTSLSRNAPDAADRGCRFEITATVLLNS